MVLIFSGSSLTEGSIWKSMLLFALPVFLGNVFQQLYNTFDSWVVGNYLGDNALAAVSSSGSLIFMMIGFFNGVAMGAGVIIARCYGAKDYASMRRAIHTDVAFGLTAGILLTVLGVAFTPTILRWMNTPEDVLPQSISYFRYYFCGAIFTVMYNIMVGILHAVGDSRHPLYYLIFSSFVNVVLDLLFVAVFRWGVGSAAIATTISQGVSALLCFRLLLTTKESYRVELKKSAITGTASRTSSATACPPACRTALSPWPIWWSRPTSTASARPPWPAAAPIPRSKASPSCPSPALPRPCPPSWARIWVPSSMAG